MTRASWTRCSRSSPPDAQRFQLESCNGNGSRSNWSVSRGLADHGHVKAASRPSDDPLGHAVSLLAGKCVHGLGRRRARALGPPRSVEMRAYDMEAPERLHFAGRGGPPRRPRGRIVRGGVQVVVAQGPALAAASRCSLRPGHWAHADPALHATPKLARWGAAPRSATARG
jgi:hypothetical protein